MEERQAGAEAAIDAAHEPSELAAELRLDGNSAAGLLQQVFPFEMSTTRSHCAGCGAIEPRGALHGYGGAGQVLRCPHCESVVLRIVHSDGRYRLDPRGAGYLELKQT